MAKRQLPMAVIWWQLETCAGRVIKLTCLSSPVCSVNRFGEIGVRVHSCPLLCAIQ